MLRDFNTVQESWYPMFQKFLWLRREPLSRHSPASLTFSELTKLSGFVLSVQELYGIEEFFNGRGNFCDQSVLMISYKELDITTVFCFTLQLILFPCIRWCNHQYARVSYWLHRNKYDAYHSESSLYEFREKRTIANSCYRTVTFDNFACLRSVCLQYDGLGQSWDWRTMGTRVDRMTSAPVLYERVLVNKMTSSAGHIVPETLRFQCLGWPFLSRKISFIRQFKRVSLFNTFILYIEYEWLIFC